MHFGRVQKVEGIDLSVPPDSSRTEKFLSLARQSETQLYIGCPIWSSKAWMENVYPKGTKTSQFLSVYAKTFNCVELNSSFYHLPDASQISHWRDETPEGFRFCPKVFRGITEDLASPQLPALVERYCDAVSHFSSRLGLTFAQFSEHFAPFQKPLLERFLDLWPAEIPLAVELRHPAWFHQHALLDEMVNLFYRKKVATVITDTAGRRDVLHLSLTQPKVLIRFQGNELHAMDEVRLQAWAERIHKWQAHHLEEIYFFTHQPGDENIPETARMALREMTGVEPPRLPSVPQQLEIL